MRQYYCPECGHAFAVSGKGMTGGIECPNCNRRISIPGEAAPRAPASLLPGVQFLRGRSYGWYSTLVKGRRG